MVEFYACGSKTLHFNKNTEHLTRNELLLKNNTWLKGGHDWIQILVPGTEPSNYVSWAPVLSPDEIMQIPRARVSETIRRLENYFDYIAGASLWDPHENLRVTRIIKFLRLRGCMDEASSFHERMLNLEGPKTEDSHSYWKDAAELEPVGFPISNKANVLGDGDCLINAAKMGLAARGLDTKGIERPDLIEDFKISIRDPEFKVMLFVELLEDDFLVKEERFKNYLQGWRKALQDGNLSERGFPNQLFEWMKDRRNYWFGSAGVGAICRILAARQVSLVVWQTTTADVRRMSRVCSGSGAFTQVIHVLRSNNNHYDCLCEAPRDP